MRGAVPLFQRPVDVVLIAFFAFNVVCITYMQGFEQLSIPDPNDFEYPPWPPRFMVDLVHWWGRNFDPLLMARPTWWKAIIAIDVVCFGPFYACAVYAFAKGRGWIRIPAIMWASVMLTMVIVISAEELFGPHATPRPAVVLLANGPWALFPILVLYRMGTQPHPFSRAAAGDVGPAELTRRLRGD